MAGDNDLNGIQPGNSSANVIPRWDLVIGVAGVAGVLLLIFIALYLYRRFNSEADSLEGAKSSTTRAGTFSSRSSVTTLSTSSSASKEEDESPSSSLTV